MEGASQIKEDKNHNDKIDWLGFAMDPDYGIPRLCHCGELLTEVVFEKQPQDTCPGKRFIICTKYKNSGGPHIRTPWVFGVSVPEVGEVRPPGVKAAKAAKRKKIGNDAAYDRLEFIGNQKILQKLLAKKEPLTEMEVSLRDKIMSEMLK